VQSPRQWKLETVIMLGGGLMISFSAGIVLIAAVRKLLPGLPEPTAQFYSSIVMTLAFQGAALALTHLLLKRNERTWWSFLGLDDPHLKQALLRALAVVTMVLPMALALRAGAETLLKHLRDDSTLQPALQVIQMSNSAGRLFYAGVIAVLLAPVAEEILFRGILYPAIKQMGWPRLALFSTSVLFGAIHGHLASFIPLCFLGAVFALLYDRTSNLLAPILAHSAFNAVNFFMFVFYQKTTS